MNQQTHGNFTKYQNTNSQLIIDNEEQQETDAMINDINDESLVTSYQVFLNEKETPGGFQLQRLRSSKFSW